MSGITRSIVAAALLLLGTLGVTSVLASGGGFLDGGSDDSPPAQLTVAEEPDRLLDVSDDLNEDGAVDQGEDVDDEDDADEAEDEDELEIVGDAIGCPSGEDSEFKFEVEGDEFEVTGLLVSLDDTTVMVMGPDGEVTAALDAAEIDDGPQPGDPVKVEGSVLDDGSFVARKVESACEGENEELEECNRGPGEEGDLRVEVEDNEIEIKRGTVLSFDGGALTVDAPGGPFTVMIDVGTEVGGDLSSATEVRVEGALTDGSNVLADKVKVLCPHPEDDDDADVEDEFDDVDDDEGEGEEEDADDLDDDEGDHAEDEGEVEDES